MTPTQLSTHPAAQVLAELTLPPVTPLGDRRAAFLGCGDSLAAARPAEQLGHRVLSAGDVAWSGQAPRGVDVVVALSWSGQTGATIAAAQVAKDAGLPVVALTTNPRSPLAALADEHVVLPQVSLTEQIPALGYAVHSAAVAALCTGRALDLAAVADDWSAVAEVRDAVVDAAGPLAHGITVASMPDAHGAAEMWMLKLIEATGLVVRTTAIEEVGHVDYFIGDQPHLTLLLSGDAQAPRADRLGAALEANGQTVVHVRLASVTQSAGTTREVVGGVLGADVAGALAARWGRPPFRGGVVDMSAQHIQVPAT